MPTAPNFEVNIKMLRPTETFAHKITKKKLPAYGKIYLFCVFILPRGQKAGRAQQARFALDLDVKRTAAGFAVRVRFGCINEKNSE